MSFFKQEISKNVWNDTYKWETDTDVFHTFKRKAVALASIEKNVAHFAEKYYELFSDSRYMMGGRVISNAGTGLSGTSMINCFVSGFSGTDRDSIEGIYSELKRQAKILKSEGGYGFCCDVMRPRGGFVEGIGTESPGSVALLDLWDTSSAVITSGSGKRRHKGRGKNKIRKGAQMVTHSDWHPDIEEFVTAKQVPGKLTKFNMSVLIHDRFIEACSKNDPWNLEFPDTAHAAYKKDWDGDLYEWKSKGYPTVIYKTYPNANELLDLILKSMYNRNEPGIIFIDRINQLNNLAYLEKIDATNPCGEQALPHHGSCNLGAINLVRYINASKTDFDYEKLSADIPYIVRMQDAINDLSGFPLPEQKLLAANRRRVGIGYMGYGSALYLLKTAYGSPKALEMTERLCRFVTNKLYQASADLAEEKGAFPDFDKEKYLKSKFVEMALDKETTDRIAQKGIRNSHLCTVAPTGNTSVFMNCVSGGLEPVISDKYVRTVIVPYAPESLEVPLVDWSNKTATPTGQKWEWIKEGDESLLRTNFNGSVYKIDRNRGLTREETVYDYSVLEMGDDFWKDKEEMSPEAFYGKTINDLTIKEHVDTMAIFARYIDASISKTINIPNDYPYESFKDLVMSAYDSKTIKGITTYRWGTMASVISSGKSESKQDRPTSIVESSAPKRPKTLPCDVFQTQIKGEKWNVVVGKLDGRPFEMFAGPLRHKLPATGTVVKKSSQKYFFEGEGVESFDLVAEFGEHGTYAYSKMLNHGIPPWSIVDMCDKMIENILGFNKAMGRILKKYITNEDAGKLKCSSCGGKLTFTEGCVSCIFCGVSKCG